MYTMLNPSIELRRYHQCHFIKILYNQSNTVLLNYILYHSIHACYNQSFEVYNDLLDHDLPYHSLVEFRTLQCYPFVPKLTSLLSIPYFTILILNSIFNDSIHACYIQSIEAYHVLPLFNSILYHSSHV